MDINESCNIKHNKDKAMSLHNASQGASPELTILMTNVW